MLPKTNRIKKKVDFEIIFKKGKNLNNNLFVLKFLSNNLGLSRFAFVISQKVSKKAVVRNKIRRQLVKIIKNHFSEIKVGQDMVFIVLKEINKKSFFEIESELINTLKKGKLI